MTDRRAPSLYRAHPWHGVSLGDEAPAKVTVYVEIVPTDTVKYELDKESGLLKVDRPQKFSNVVPSLYGFLPLTYCGEENGALTARRAGRTRLMGDGDPLDVCVLTEKAIGHGDILMTAIPIGGLRMIDGDEADDKIIAVLEGDAVYGSWKEISEAPSNLVDRLRHYFLTYKQVPGAARPKVEIAEVYGREDAYEVIAACRKDYETKFGPGA